MRFLRRSRREPDQLTPPNWWYFWPDAADEAYQADLAEWRKTHDGVRLRDVNRVVFLDQNRPPELTGLTPAELREQGVIILPGQEASDLFLVYHEAANDVTLTPEQRVDVLRGHFALIGVTPPS
jgi:hypothetical protein